jgi:hypothetical protein
MRCSLPVLMWTISQALLALFRCDSGNSRVDDAHLADLDQLSDEERATITNLIDALVTKAKLRLITGGAG